MPPTVLRCRVYILEGVILLDNTASIACASRLVQRQIPLSSTLCRLLSCGATHIFLGRVVCTRRLAQTQIPRLKTTSYPSGICRLLSCGESIIICRIIRLKIKFVLFKKRIMPLCRKTKRRLPVFFCCLCIV